MTRQRLRTAAAGTVFAASLASVGIWAAGDGFPAARVRSGMIALPNLATRPLPNPAALASTLARPLFNPDRKPAPAPAAPDDAAGAASPASGLIAVAIGPDRRAAILKLVSGRTAVLLQGEQIDGWTLSIVAAHRVLLRSASQQTELSLPGSDR